MPGTAVMRVCISLCTGYAMPGTAVMRLSTCLCARYAMPGTDVYSMLVPGYARAVPCPVVVGTGCMRGPVLKGACGCTRRKSCRGEKCVTHVSQPCVYA
eukprot:2864301-Rhodomonas_salina.3